MKPVIALVYPIEVDNLAVVDSKEKWVVEHVLYAFEAVWPTLKEGQLLSI